MRRSPHRTAGRDRSARRTGAEAADQLDSVSLYLRLQERRSCACDSGRKNQRE